jgi:hypothetical protein
MNPNIMQTLCQVAVAIGLVITALGGFGAYYYGTKVEKLKTPITQNKIQHNFKVDSPANSPIIGNVENQTINYFQSKQKTLKKHNMKKDDKENDKTVNITSYNQSGGITANHVNIGAIPREINSESEILFINEIKKYPVENIKIRTLFSDAESQSMSIKIKNIFEKVGWSVEGPIYEIPNQPMYNVTIGIPIAEKESTTALVLYNWLNLNKLKVTAELIPEENGKTYIIFVGLNQ